MSETLTPSSSFDNTTLVVPSAAELLQSANNKANFQKVVDSLQWLSDALSVGESVTFNQPLSAGKNIGEFGEVISGADYYWQQSGTTSPFLWLPLTRLPLVTGTLTDVQVYIDPANTHSGTLPATKPTLALYRRVGTGAATPVGSVLDPSVNAAAYEAAHLITLTGLSENLDDPSVEYFATLSGESGANSQIDMQVLACQAVVSITGN